ncbi:MAG: hypothetical protein HIU83_09345 [Proteobacteria bacterium]|nr:hypothetical protein [Pseudomonadota bacterium]
MKCIHLCILASTLLFLCSCTLFGARNSAPTPVVYSPTPLVVPVGKNWQVIEEAPKLSDGKRLPFQTEQSVQPAGARPVSPTNRTLETPH